MSGKPLKTFFAVEDASTRLTRHVVEQNSNCTVPDRPGIGSVKRGFIS